jgi:hypothetical protein
MNSINCCKEVINVLLPRIYSVLNIELCELSIHFVVVNLYQPSGRCIAFPVGLFPNNADCNVILAWIQEIFTLFGPWFQWILHCDIISTSCKLWTATKTLFRIEDQLLAPWNWSKPSAATQNTSPVKSGCRTIAQASRPPRRPGFSTIRLQDSWWTKWHWSGFLSLLFGFPLLIIILQLLYSHLSRTEVCGSPDQAAHYHIVSPNLLFLSMTWHLACLEVKVVFKTCTILKVLIFYAFLCFLAFHLFIFI